MLYIIYYTYLLPIFVDLIQIFVIKKMSRRDCPKEQYTCNKLKEKKYRK